MPKITPKCCECEGTESLLWRTVEQGQICQECYGRKLAKEVKEPIIKDEKVEQKDVTEKPKESGGGSSSSNNSKEDTKELTEAKPTTPLTTTTTTTTTATTTTEERHKSIRKSTRTTRFKSKTSSTNSAHANNNNNSTAIKSQSKRNRRNLFKKTPMKMPSLQASTRYTESVFYKGSYMQVGDIVSLVDKEDNVYYAQIRGLLVDDFCEKSAYLSWLIPTQESPDPRERFDPASYLIGYDEDFPRKLNYLDFVMHAPSNYYYDRTQPFPLPDEMDTERKSGAYIWTRLPGWERQRT